MNSEGYFMKLQKLSKTRCAILVITLLQSYPSWSAQTGTDGGDESAPHTLIAAPLTSQELFSELPFGDQFIVESSEVTSLPSTFASPTLKVESKTQPEQEE